MNLNYLLVEEARHEQKKKNSSEFTFLNSTLLSRMKEFVGGTYFLFIIFSSF